MAAGTRRGRWRDRGWKRGQWLGEGLQMGRWAWSKPLRRAVPEASFLFGFLETSFLFSFSETEPFWLFFWRWIHFPKVIPSPGTSPPHHIGDAPVGLRAGSPHGVALAQPQPPKDTGALFAGLRPLSNFDNSGPASCHGPRIFLEGPPPSPGVVSRSISSSGLML